jgi:hypothetical protein
VVWLSSVSIEVNETSLMPKNLAAELMAKTASNATTMSPIGRISEAFTDAPDRFGERAKKYATAEAHNGHRQEVRDAPPRAASHRVRR